MGPLFSRVNRHPRSGVKPSPSWLHRSGLEPTGARSMSTILVTGATGTIGSRTVSALAKTGATVRAGVRKPQKQGEVKFDYEDSASIAKAVEGVDAIFVVTPFAPNQVELGKAL